MQVPALLALFFFFYGTVRAGDPQAIELPGIHHAFKVTERIYSGSQPEGDAAFAALAAAGVKTIITVDGGKPDVEAARKHGLRYVHLPIGYDGIPAHRIPELAKAVNETTGGVFVHCHHGKHRGPAAIGVICEATAGWTPAQAEAWLKQAGTAADYAGLYKAVREFRPPTEEQLAKVGPLPEIAKTGDLVDAMVAIDAYFDALKAAQKNGWKAPPDNPDASPAHQATLLWEQFREMARTPDTAGRPDEYRKHVAESERGADALRTALKAATLDPVRIEGAFKTTAQHCAGCHKAYRNNR